LAALAAVPGRDPVPPPELPRDAPVADVVHPVEEGLRPALGDELGLALLDRRLASLAMADRVHVRLGTSLEPQLLEPRLDRLARLEAVEPLERAALGVDDPRLVEDRDHRQVVAEA